MGTPLDVDYPFGAQISWLGVANWLRLLKVGLKWNKVNWPPLISWFGHQMDSQPQEGYPWCHWRMGVLQVQWKNLEFCTSTDGLRFEGKQDPKLKFFSLHFEMSHSSMTPWVPLSMFGLVWFGMVWNGLVWFGLVWYGMVWLFLALLVLVCYWLLFAVSGAGSEQYNPQHGPESDQHRQQLGPVLWTGQ